MNLFMPPLLTTFLSASKTNSLIRSVSWVSPIEAWRNCVYRVYILFPFSLYKLLTLRCSIFTVKCFLLYVCFICSSFPCLHNIFWDIHMCVPFLKLQQVSPDVVVLVGQWIMLIIGNAEMERLLTSVFSHTLLLALWMQSIQPMSTKRLSKF